MIGSWFSDLPDIVRLAIYVIAGSIVFGVFVQTLIVLVGIILALRRR